MATLEKKDGYTVFTKEKGKDFRILQLTDIHIGAGCLSHKKDKLALAAVEKVITAAKPDLIVITGDLVHPLAIFSGSFNNMKELKLLTPVLEKFNVPWTFVFGNHDQERHSLYKKAQLAEYVKTNCPNCLFEKGAENVSGYGNYAIKLNNADGKLNTALMLFDSNMYVGKGFYSGFDVIHDDQIKWYKNEIAKLSGGKTPPVPSLAFFHIPVKEFKTAWDLCYRGSPEVKYHLGFVQEKDNYVGYAKHVEGHFFDEMLKLGSCKGMFCGHDHLSVFSLTYKGIRLTYGMSIDYLAYRKISKCHTQRGGTIITIADDSSFDVALLPLDDLT